jgi:hypothetical protein
MFLWFLAEVETKHVVEWKTLLPAWVIALLVLVILAWIFWCYKYETASSSTLVKTFLGILRLMILFALLAILCEPTLFEETSSTRKSYLVFMVDSSLSMNTKDHYQTEK